MATRNPSKAFGVAELFGIPLYLLAIVMANLLVAKLGQVALIVTGLFLIPFDLVIRDVLHSKWHGHGITWKMGVLICTGSLLTYAVNQSAGRIALASAIAFAITATADTLVFALWRSKSKATRMHASNTVSALVDSLAFPLLAFGGIMVWVSLSQFILKTIGGMFWTEVYVKIQTNLANPRNQQTRPRV